MSALVVVVGVTSHIVSGAAHSDIERVLEDVRLRGVLLTILRLLGIEREAAHNPSRLQKNLTTKLPRTGHGTGAHWH